MDAARLDLIRKRFQRYLERFRLRNRTFPLLVQIKVDHSFRVSTECAEIAEELGWKRGTVNLVRALGLLHDIGRFRQVSEHGTFWDNRSVAHAELGVRILRSSRILTPCNEREKRLILLGVRHHSKPDILDDLDPKVLHSLNLLRDADKLDILRVAVETMIVRDSRGHPDLVLGISRNSPPSPDLIEEVLNNRSAPYDRAKSLADLTAIRMAWVYHINYAATLRRIRDRRLLEQMMECTPYSHRLAPVFEAARLFILDQVGPVGRPT